MSNTFLLGYRDKRIPLYRTPLKPLGYVVAAMGFASLVVAVIPNGLGALFYPLGFSLLGMVGISTIPLEKKVRNSARFSYWKFKQFLKGGINKNG